MCLPLSHHTTTSVCDFCMSADVISYEYLYLLGVKLPKYVLTCKRPYRRIAGHYTTAPCKLNNADTGARAFYPRSSLASPTSSKHFRREDDPGKTQRERLFLPAPQPPPPRHAAAGAVLPAAASASLARSVGERLPCQRRDERGRSCFYKKLKNVSCEYDRLNG